MRIRKSLINKTDGTTSLADDRSNGKRSANSLDGSIGVKLDKSKPPVWERPVGQLTNYAIVGEVPVEIRLGPFLIRFHESQLRYIPSQTGTIPPILPAA